MKKGFAVFGGITCLIGLVTYTIWNATLIQVMAELGGLISEDMEQVFRVLSIFTVILLLPVLPAASFT